MDIIENKSLRLIFPCHYRGKKYSTSEKKRQNMVKKGRKEKTRLPIMKCFLISQAYQKWNRVLAFDPEPTKPPNQAPSLVPRSYTLILQHWTLLGFRCCLFKTSTLSPSLEKVIVYLEYRADKWLILLIQTHSIMRLHKSSQNFRHSFRVWKAQVSKPGLPFEKLPL